MYERSRGEGQTDFFRFQGYDLGIGVFVFATNSAFDREIEELDVSHAVRLPEGDTNQSARIV